jgi:hypothetical protein
LLNEKRPRHPVSASSHSQNGFCFIDSAASNEAHPNRAAVNNPTPIAKTTMVSSSMYKEFHDYTFHGGSQHFHPLITPLTILWK